jgi:hypothetical protein
LVALFCLLVVSLVDWLLAVACFCWLLTSAVACFCRYLLQLVAYFCQLLASACYLLLLVAFMPYWQ